MAWSGWLRRWQPHILILPADIFRCLQSVKYQIARSLSVCYLGVPTPATCETCESSVRGNTGPAGWTPFPHFHHTTHSASQVSPLLGLAPSAVAPHCARRSFLCSKQTPRCCLSHPFFRSVQRIASVRRLTADVSRRSTYWHEMPFPGTPVLLEFIRTPVAFCHSSTSHCPTPRRAQCDGRGTE